MIEWIIPDELAGSRLDAALAQHLRQTSRSKLQTWIKAGRVLLDGAAERASTLVSAGQRVTIDPPDAPAPRLEPLEIPLSVIYEDDDLLVIDKPAGLQVHPGAGEPRPTLAHALIARYPHWAAPGSPERPGLVHRLDRDTSGLMVIARREPAFQDLVRQIQRRETTRRYVALAWGTIREPSGSIDAPIARDPGNRRKMTVSDKGRPAQSDYRVLHRFDWLTLIEVSLRTGRTHQIRVHLAHLGHPLFGDPTYGRSRVWLDRIPPARRAVLTDRLRRLNRQALHAYHLACRHPSGGGNLRFESPVPADLDQLLLQLRIEESSG